jgi:hypothetical protein
LAVNPHRLVPGAFGDGVEGVGEEAIRLVGQQTARALIVARTFHQRRDQLEVLEAA